MTNFLKPLETTYKTAPYRLTKAMAERVLYQADDFIIQDDQLWHLARLKSKRLQQISPRFHQLCIPKSF
jgi:hypothetical protein